MADLSTKTLSQVKSGWLHSIVDNTGSISALSSSAIRTVADGDDNKSKLFLTKEKSILIGGFDSTDTATDNALFIKSINDAEDTLRVRTSLLSDYNEYKIIQPAINNILHSNKREGTDGILQTSFQSRGKNDEGVFAFYPSDSSGTSHETMKIENKKVGINISNPTEALHVYGNIQLSGGVLLQSTRIFHVDGVNGDDTNSGWTLGNALQTINEAMNRMSGMNGCDIKIFLHGADNSSSGNISDNLYQVSTNCWLYNCSLSIQGMVFDGYSDMDDTDVELDYPRIGFDMHTHEGNRMAYGFKLNNCNASVKHLRMITPIFDATLLSTPSKELDGIFSTLEGGRFNISLSFMRTEIGDAPVVSGGVTDQINITVHRNRIIRSNTALTYGGVGQNGGQDNSGTANLPVWTSSTHFVNATDTNGKTLGLLTDTYYGSVFLTGDTEVYSGGNGGVFGAFPHTSSATYSYLDPTTNDQKETEINLFGNRTAQYVTTTDGTTPGKKPLNFNTNRFAGWYI
tara:strand:+ start:3531 stop:5072 length:1542 start_codon:yes stop_codon:yes gene_type:complete